MPKSSRSGNQNHGSTHSGKTSMQAAVTTRPSRMQPTAPSRAHQRGR